MWLANFFAECGAFGVVGPSDGGNDAVDAVDEDVDVVDRASEEAMDGIVAEFDRLVMPWDVTFVFVTTSEIDGSSVLSSSSLLRRAEEEKMTPSRASSRRRKFVDALGWMNRHVANRAETVVHVIAGVPNYIKRPSSSYSGGRRDPFPSRAELSDVEMSERTMLDAFLSSRKLNMDARGYFLMNIDHDIGVIRATYHSCIKNEMGEICDLYGKKIGCSDDDEGEGGPPADQPMATFEARTAKELTVMIFERWEHAGDLVSVGHAAYVGREAQRAEGCLFAGRFYQQD